MLTLDQLPDDFTPQQFMQLDRESLEKVPYTRLRWSCQGKRCTNGTHVRDYSISPWYFLDRNSKSSHSSPGKYWLNLHRTYWMCGRHWKIHDRLIKSFPAHDVEQKIIDLSLMPEDLLRKFPNK